MKIAINPEKVFYFLFFIIGLLTVASLTANYLKFIHVKLKLFRGNPKFLRYAVSKAVCDKTS